MTSVRPWQPLSTRTQPFEVFTEGISHALQHALREWIYSASAEKAEVVDRVVLRVQLRYVDQPEDTLDDAEPTDEQKAYAERKRLFLAFDTSTTRLLDVVDALLDLLPLRPPELPATASPNALILRALERFERDVRPALQQHLDDARSIYTISRDCRRLERRADENVAAAVREAGAAAAGNSDSGSAADHLRRSWASLHLRQPDAARAYSEAIKAVEAAAHAVVQPRHAGATLGTMLGELRSQRLRFTLGGSPDEAGVTVLISLIERLWTGQKSRHGSRTPTPEETLTDAQVAVDLATVLVRWFATGYVERPGR
jgi:hypothetical protein